MDSLLEHYMPSLMALKKALPGRQPRSFIESFIFVVCFYKVQIHCIIKIMCQDLPLGCLHCLLVCAVQDRNFGCSARFYIFYWNVKRF